MKKLIIIIVTVICLCIAIYVTSVYFYHINCEARYFNWNDIYYRGTHYYDWYDISENYIQTGEIYHDDMYPYALIDGGINEKSMKIYLAHNDFIDTLVNPFLYFCYTNESLDKNNFFITHDSKWRLDLFVKENFIFPTLEGNEIDEVWMSASSTYEIIKDKEKVAKIVECAKSKGELELDEEVVEYIKKYSWDNHCFYLKYAGYPLIEEFHIEETEDGRYVVDQFTAEEYDTIYYHNTAHQ